MSAYIKEINGIKYNIKVEEVLYFQSQALWKAIQSIPTNELKEGYKFEIGFSLYVLQSAENGYNIVVPDYTTSPFLETTDDLTLAFLIQMEQIKVLQEYNISGDRIRFDDEIIVAKDALLKSTICLQRFKDLHGSGWCINEIKQDDDGKFENVETNEYEVIYAYQLLALRPSLLSVLLLPYDYMAIFNENDCIEILNENNQSVISTENEQ